MNDAKPVVKKKRGRPAKKTTEILKPIPSELLEKLNEVINLFNEAESINIFQLKKDDMIVLRFRGHLSMEQMKKAYEDINFVTGGTHRIAIIDGSLELCVLRDI